MAEGVSVFWRRMCIQYVPSSDCVMSFSDPLEVGFIDGSFHQLFEVFEFQMAALAPGQFRVQLPVRVAPECTLTDSPLGHFLQPVKMLVYCLGFHFTICT